MRAQLTGLVARGFDGDVRLWRPRDPERFGVELQVVLAADSGETHAFDVGVCSPSWFAERFATAALRRPDTRRLRGLDLFRRLAGAGRPYDVERAGGLGAPAPVTGLVFASEWDHRRLAAAIRGLCERVEDRDGAALAAHVARVLPWEYDYRWERARRRPAAVHHRRLAA